ncbi:hypothetical protein AAFF_G00347650 [Aldrovandia affinis]|uniref:Uncharacterized protein n=1 Tax=Aldrovandia affinis TaxID=143900 RepID=A0AAD7SKW0_9TELE|nr:hypothetical protein AAFF_G00347650 [Aldrovandia affinis]
MSPQSVSGVRWIGEVVQRGIFTSTWRARRSSSSRSGRVESGDVGGAFACDWSKRRLTKTSTQKVTLPNSAAARAAQSASE